MHNVHALDSHPLTGWRDAMKGSDVGSDHAVTVRRLVVVDYEIVDREASVGKALKVCRHGPRETLPVERLRGKAVPTTSRGAQFQDAGEIVPIQKLHIAGGETSNVVRRHV